jgi:hypothetical protein
MNSSSEFRGSCRNSGGGTLPLLVLTLLLLAVLLFAGCGSGGLDVQPDLASLNSTTTQPESARCDACHAYPPTTGSHRDHLTRRSDKIPDGTITCDDCHWTSIYADSAMVGGMQRVQGAVVGGTHWDGWLQVKFDPENLPSGKGWDGTYCSNIACHSGAKIYRWSTGSDEDEEED